MSITDTVYRVAHSYPGGIPALAARMDMSKHVLQNKVNPNNDTHKLSAEEAAQIADLADCDEIARAYAERRNLVCIPVTEHQGASDMELIDLIIEMEKQKAEWLESIKKALSDGVIDPAEAKRIRKEYLEHVAAIAELTSRVEGMVTERRKVAR